MRLPYCAHWTHWNHLTYWNHWNHLTYWNHFTYWKSEKYQSLTHLLTTWNQEMLAHVIKNCIQGVPKNVVIEQNNNQNWELLIIECDYFQWLSTISGDQILVDDLNDNPHLFYFNIHWFSGRMSDSTGFEKAARSRKGILTAGLNLGLCEETGWKG